MCRSLMKQKTVAFRDVCQKCQLKDWCFEDLWASRSTNVGQSYKTIAVIQHRDIVRVIVAGTLKARVKERACNGLDG